MLQEWMAVFFITAIGMVTTVAASEMQPGAWIPVGTAVDVHVARPAEDRSTLGWCDSGSRVVFGPLRSDDGLVDRMEFKVASPRSGGHVSVHLDTEDGPRIARLTVAETGGYNTYNIQQTACEQLAGEHRLVFVFSGGQGICNVQAFRFLKPGQASPEAVRYEDVASRNAASLDERIARVLELNTPGIISNRTSELVVRATPGSRVTVRQQSHAFRFGTAISRNAFRDTSRLSEADRKQYCDVLKANFNAAVHENALKWYSTERSPGKHRFEDADRMLDWCEQNGLALRGHAVYWGRDKLVPQWQKDMDDDALLAKLEERARTVMTRYRGRISEYDVNNEMVHCTYYRKRFGADIWRKMFAWCREADPDARLYVNDYSILTGGSLSKYCAQIQGFLDADMPVGGIGVQGHYGSKVNRQKALAVLDRLAQFGLPIAITEFDANTRDEAAQALALVTLYSTAFSHPAVDAILMWGFWEGAHWRPDAAMWRRDWTAKRAAHWYRELVFKRWWTDVEGVAGEDGIYRVRVFHGEHDVTADGTTRRVRVGANATEWDTGRGAGGH